jgi:ParB-like chromosome segregation protein Spo0J
MARKRQTNAASALISSVTADMLGGYDDSDSLGQDNSLRVERILLDLVRPNPLQARRVLPDRVYQDFHAERMTPTQALREVVKLAKIAAKQNGRPFDNVLDLLGNPEDDNATEPSALTPIEGFLRDLTNLAVTIRDDGQVNPLTVVDASDGGIQKFRIETGERRYWATWLLKDFIPSYQGDGMIPCIIIPQEKESPFRQAKENTTRAGLNAVAMARQIALLLLYVHGVEMPGGPVTMDFYRQALELDLRGKREYTDAVYSALGGISKTQFSKHKALLKLCDEAIELADRHSLEASILDGLIQLTPEDQVELIQQILRLGLTQKQIRDIIQKGCVNATNLEDEPEPLPKSVMQIARLALKPDERFDAGTLARALIGMERDKGVAKARLKALRDLLEEAELHIDDL